MIAKISLVISLLTLVFSLYQYFVHGRKLMKQQIRINLLELEKHKKENEAASKADIRLSYDRNKESGSQKLYVENCGLCTATNIKLRLENIDDIYNITPTLDKPIEHLEKGSKRGYTITLLEGQNNATFIVSWEDGYSKDNQLNQTVDFL